jgi:hypothetical protein
MCIECGCNSVGSETGVTDVTMTDSTMQMNNGEM